MRYRVFMSALCGMIVLSGSGCGSSSRVTSRDTVAAYETRATTKESNVMTTDRMDRIDCRDSVNEVTVITVDRNEKGDTVFRSVVTKRERVRSRDNIAAYRTSSAEKRDSVVEVKRDSVTVSTTNRTNDTNQSRATALQGTLRWVSWIIVGVIGLTIARGVFEQKMRKKKEKEEQG